VHSGTAPSSAGPYPFNMQPDSIKAFPPLAILPDTQADIRWRDWQARGAAGDRRTAARMRKVMLLVAAALIVWFVVQLT